MPETILSTYSEKTRRFYKLFRTEDFPALEISGIRMHCVQDTTPKKSTLDMIEPLKPIHGNVLDCCAGLGYTVIALSREKNVSKVFTFEKDPNVFKLAKQNAFSRALFDSEKIEFAVADVLGEIQSFSDSFFDCILHDPPSIKIAGELYSQAFYNQLYRVLKQKGKLFHYTGSPSGRGGKDIMKGVINRLQEAGFKNVKRIEKSKGILALK
jgi:predicted methyltransferase